MATATSPAVMEVDEITADQDQYQPQQVLSTNDVKVDETDDKASQSKQLSENPSQKSRTQPDNAAVIVDQTPLSAMEVDDSQTQPQQDEYPTGFKFLLTFMAAFVLLTLLGLVGSTPSHLTLSTRVMGLKQRQLRSMQNNENVSGPTGLI
jgi:hypothetical protein